jgi:soluble lytic murein transglycosylase
MGWHDRAIITANSAGLHDALDLRFPMPFRDRVEYYSMRNQLDIPFTFALLRKESAFMPDAVSSAGARGLMQVMPATGKGIARRLKEPPPSAHGLMDVETNLRFGSAYLRQVLDRFGNNAVLAAAAYNAGPRRVDDWLERNAGQPPALWIENISFRETRQYVKDVLAFASVFQWQLHGSIQRRLSDVIGVRSQHSTSQPVSK